MRGPDTHVLRVKGWFTGKLKRREQEVEEEIYVVKGLHKPLLGRPAIERLGLVVRVEAIEGKTLNPTQQFPQSFKGLGKLEGDYKIELEPGAKPYALSTP